ncbi:hypothetical protein VFPFJ_10837 [Purpureocillium lilacinum]|uniref:Uncharacterized protein n=1 Tax=Purpureocillium lilacinum TaxID=33203 RepID=A0A179GDE0_PURLI|nr:hypothetical protein VFPFJ_10837 [Purpureocillium lilacinum]OAQ75847.1 hypothetical protein VFPFJ_10837 [Purpureocillium lilacinum]OAQ80497.1 hypothetical protein VFPBJ_06082 [Purpureocillium lilacinum]
MRTSRHEACGLTMPNRGTAPSPIPICNAPRTPSSQFRCPRPYFLAFKRLALTATPCRRSQPQRRKHGGLRTPTHRAYISKHVGPRADPMRASPFRRI